MRPVAWRGRAPGPRIPRARRVFPMTPSQAQARGRPVGPRAPARDRPVRVAPRSRSLCGRTTPTPDSLTTERNACPRTKRIADPLLRHPRRPHLDPQRRRQRQPLADVLGPVARLALHARPRRVVQDHREPQAHRRMRAQPPPPPTSSAPSTRSLAPPDLTPSPRPRRCAATAPCERSSSEPG
jgi:hypothetical protein